MLANPIPTQIDRLLRLQCMRLCITNTSQPFNSIFTGIFMYVRFQANWLLQNVKWTIPITRTLTGCCRWTSRCRGKCMVLNNFSCTFSFYYYILNDISNVRMLQTWLLEWISRLLIFDLLIVKAQRFFFSFAGTFYRKVWIFCALS